MLTIGITSSKGGAGKSTFASNLAIELFDRGIPVAFIDADDGAPSARILNRDVPDLPTSVAKTDGIKRETKLHRDQGRIVILDAPGKASSETTAICQVADLVIVPLVCCERDLIQSTAALCLIRVFQNENDGKPEAVIALNRTVHNDKLAPIFRNQLEPLGIPIATAQVRHNMSTQRGGVFVRDKGANPTADSFRELIAEVIEPRLETQQARIANG